jgi:hypothetical protein
MTAAAAAAVPGLAALAAVAAAPLGQRFVTRPPLAAALDC